MEISMASGFDIVDYGRRLERVLLAQREVSAIINHRGEIGSAREFFVESILRRFLPANVVVGRGEIVDGDGGRSRQQDLLLYRDNFPVMDSLAGSHIYLAEGVLATIEVKSSLSGEDVAEATKNIASVRGLRVSDRGLGGAARVSGAESSLEGLSDPLDVSGTEDPLLSPAEERIWSFVFAFDGPTAETLVKHARDNSWLDGSGPDCVCVLGKAFGASHSTPIRPASEPKDGESFSMEAATEPLGWWLGHLVWVLNRCYRRPHLRPYYPSADIG